MAEQERIYNIKVNYGSAPFAHVSAAGTNKCKIKRISAHSWHYCFEDAYKVGGAWDWNEPILRVEELIDSRTKEVTHLKCTIDSWDGEISGSIVWGTNEVPIFLRDELKYPLAANAGESRVISITQIEDPTIFSEIPVEESWWDKLPWQIKGAMIGAPILFGIVYIWRKAK